MAVSSLQCGGNTTFFPVFPLAGSTAKAFFRLSLWSFKEKSVNHFLWHSFFQIFILNWLCLSLWLIQDSNWKGRALWRLSGGLATILQDWISCNEQKMREAHITRRGTSFYLLIFIEKKSSTVKLNTAKIKILYLQNVVKIHKHILIVAPKETV